MFTTKLADFTTKFSEHDFTMFSLQLLIDFAQCLNLSNKLLFLFLYCQIQLHNLNFVELIRF
jgi:hypothetical protein